MFEGTEKKLTLLTSVTAKGNECALRRTQVAEAASGLSCRATAPLTGTGELSKDSFLSLQRTDGKAPAWAHPVLIRARYLTGNSKCVCGCASRPGNGSFCWYKWKVSFLPAEAKVPRNTKSYFLFPLSHTYTFHYSLHTAARALLGYCR